MKRDIQTRVDFLKEFRIFKNCTASKLEQLLSHSKLMKVNRGMVMYKVGDKPDGVYLIKQGAFEVSHPTTVIQHSNEKLAVMNIDPIAKI